jgi:hypothetical protein
MCQELIDAVHHYKQMVLLSEQTPLSERTLEWVQISGEKVRDAWNRVLDLLGCGNDPASTLAVVSSSLVAGDFVNIYDQGGIPKVRKADASGGTPLKADGFVKDDFTIGDVAEIYFGNLNTKYSGLTIGAIYYLSPSSPGRVTSSPPSTANHIVQRLGKAINSSTILVEIQDTITLS